MKKSKKIMISKVKGRKDEIRGKLLWVVLQSQAELFCCLITP